MIVVIIFYAHVCTMADLGNTYALCSICKTKNTNHYCNFTSGSVKCNRPVCSICKVNVMHMEEDDPYRCSNHPLKMPSPSKTNAAKTSVAKGGPIAAKTSAVGGAPRPPRKLTVSKKKVTAPLVQAFCSCSELQQLLCLSISSHRTS